ncbi:hypothetical protein BB934_03065 [Microvirga ossetica]|uniref:Uncharacterized protein n=1 Tax=Microvirga ossetica TaxID=1882682 RepID=A0A1B2EBI2_9HYPH|nr:hypothetical protein BB934_03065 [Microvirga ossetica]
MCWIKLWEWPQRLAQPSSPIHISAKSTRRLFMRQRARGWIMPKTDIVSLLRLIDERVSSPRLGVRHRDILIRRCDILEDDLNRNRHDRLLKQQETKQGDAA